MIAHGVPYQDNTFSFKNFMTVALLLLQHAIASTHLRNIINNKKDVQVSKKRKEGSHKLYPSATVDILEQSGLIKTALQNFHSNLLCKTNPP